MGSIFRWFSIYFLVGFVLLDEERDSDEEEDRSDGWEKK